MFRRPVRVLERRSIAASFTIDSGRAEQDEVRTGGFVRPIRVSIQEIRVSEALNSDQEDAPER